MRLLFLSLILFGATHSHVLADSGVLDIDWPALNSTRGQLSARQAPYPTVLTQGIREVKLPVYLPASLSYSQKIFVVADQHFYSITVPLNLATLVVTGDRTYQQSVKNNPELERLIAHEGLAPFTRAEGMMMTDFNRFGANYSLTLECDQPDSDNRCLQDSFLEKLYRELIVVGGHS